MKTLIGEYDMTYLHNYLLNNSLRDSRKDILSIHEQIKIRKTNVVLFLFFSFLLNTDSFI